VLSRLAENLYWMGRYVERADNTARLLDVNYHALVEAPNLSKGILTEQWAPLLNITGDYERFRVHFERADRNSVPEWLTSHPDNPSSIRASLTMARENARTLRDRISSEMWNSLNRSYLSLCTGSGDDISLHDYCEAVRESTALFFGLAVATMPRDLGWLFMRTGWHLERADNVLRILQVRYRQYKGQEPVARGIELHRATSLLKSCSAFEAFRKSHHSALEPRRIAAFLLLDPNFPRSLRYSVQKVFESLQGIRAENPEVTSEPMRQAGWLNAQLTYMQSAEQITEREAPSIEELLIALASISNATKAAYFDNALDVQRQAQNQWHQGFGQGQSQGSQSQSQSQGSQSQSQGRGRQSQSQTKN
jgi:uncharacterized alpha-E superfamily protein